MARIYDVIVVGLGGMGSAACWQLARRGQRVLGLERFDLGHGMGSSHGYNRIIRLAYFEHTSYVPILRRAYELWREAERASGEQLLFITGSLDAGPEGGRIVAGSLASCHEHDLPHDIFNPAGLTARFPGWHLPAGHMAVFQPDGGFVASERAILAHARLAIAAGAELHGREPLIGWEPIAGGGVRVRTERGTYEAGRLVLAAGAWMGEIVPELAGLAVPERQALGWFQASDPSLFTPERFPVGNIETEAGHFYLFPEWGMPGVKIGLYHHFHETGRADELSRDVTSRDEEALREGLRLLTPAAAGGPALALRTCLFTNTPDEHFVLDTLPGHPQVVVASPCSGHGYKFASAIGEIVADMAMERAPRFDLGLFRLARFKNAG
jgi:sarcosine oxidase